MAPVQRVRGAVSRLRDRLVQALAALRRGLLDFLTPWFVPRALAATAPTPADDDRMIEGLKRIAETLGSPARRAEIRKHSPEIAAVYDRASLAALQSLADPGRAALVTRAELLATPLADAATGVVAAGLTSPLWAIALRAVAHLGLGPVPALGVTVVWVALAIRLAALAADTPNP